MLSCGRSSEVIGLVSDCASPASTTSDAVARQDFGIRSVTAIAATTVAASAPRNRPSRARSAARNACGVISEEPLAHLDHVARLDLVAEPRGELQHAAVRLAAVDAESAHRAAPGEPAAQSDGALHGRVLRE